MSSHDTTPDATGGFIHGVRWRVPPLAIDLAVALAVTGVTLWGTYSESNPSTEALRVSDGHVITPAPAPAYLLVAAAGLSLIWRRSHPRAVLGACLAGVLAFAALRYVSYAALIIPPIPLYAVALAVPALEAITLAAGTLIALGAVLLASPHNSVSAGTSGWPPWWRSRYSPGSPTPTGAATSTRSGRVPS